MPTLLRIDTSPLSSESSFSRHLTSEFVQRWQDSHSDSHVITRDLSATSIPPITAAWIAAAYAPAPSLTPAQREVLALSDELIAELKTADEYVLGVSMHNFSIPAVLKLWIDQIVRVGQTYAYVNGAPTGLLTNKKVTILVASGGVYTPGTARAGMNFVEPYLRSLFATLGLTEITFIYASGTGQVRYGTPRTAILEPALSSIQSQFQVA